MERRFKPDMLSWAKKERTYLCGLPAIRSSKKGTSITEKGSATEAMQSLPRPMEVSPALALEGTRQKLGSRRYNERKLVYFLLLNFPAAPVFAFLADLLGSGSLRLAEEREPVTLKKSSRRPWVLPWRLLLSRLTPLRIRSSENCFSPHMNLTSSSSFGSLHFSSTKRPSSSSWSLRCWTRSICRGGR